MLLKGLRQRICLTYAVPPAAAQNRPLTGLAAAGNRGVVEAGR
jgi:hypothetical protein